MAIPLLNYAPTTQNARVAGYEIPGDEQPKIYSAENLLSPGEMGELIEAAYRQFFFHAFKCDREPYLESQLRNGQITVRDFVRGLVLSDKYRRSFYDLNSNYRFVEQTVQRVLGRPTYSEKEKIAWSIVVVNTGIEGFIDALLESEEYLENFGYDTLPYQRRRVLPGRREGERPTNITMPRYDEYYRTILGFPKMVMSGPIRRFSGSQKPLGSGSPSYFLDMARGVTVGPQMASMPNIKNMDFKSKVPYRRV